MPKPTCLLDELPTIYVKDGLVYLQIGEPEGGIVFAARPHTARSILELARRTLDSWDDSQQSTVVPFQRATG